MVPGVLMIKQGLLDWLFKGGFKVSSGTEGYTCIYAVTMLTFIIPKERALESSGIVQGSPEWV